MRHARIKPSATACYHTIARIIERRRILGNAEKHKLHELMRGLAGFCDIRILTYAILGSHLHILMRVPQRETSISDEELLRRAAFLYTPLEVDLMADQIRRLREAGREEDAERFKNRYLRRMHDVSEFFKTFKQVFSQWYNRRSERCGPLWDGRFKSLLVENSRHALLTMAAYIELNPVRAGLARDPRQYRYCGYAEAVAGNREAREGIEELVRGLGIQGSWHKVQAVYRKRIYLSGERKQTRQGTVRAGFSREQVQQVIEEGGELPLQVVLRCRVRYFSDGVALGGETFVQNLFVRYRDRFGPTRKRGARPMRHADWSGLCTLRNLRLDPVSVN